MIITNRLFTRETPSREAKSIYIFCEGKEREFEYFRFFRDLDSRIKIEIYKLDPHEDNSPSGLLSIAEHCIVKSPNNPNPKYNFIEGDEVWIILDIDKDKRESREPKISLIRDKCKNTNAWNLALSNPCFEVWLYYHFHTNKPELENSEKCSNWKKLLNQSINGGFDTRKHPIYIETASKNSYNNFERVNDKPTIGSTNLFELSNSILPLISSKINKVLSYIDK